MTRGYSQRVNYRCNMCHGRQWMKQNMYTYAHKLVCSDCYHSIPNVPMPLFRVEYRTARAFKSTVLKMPNEEIARAYILSSEGLKAKTIISLEPYTFG